ncbi:MAG: hypothetical protein C4326_01185 [Ignavibacteria bacterium]
MDRFCDAADTISLNDVPLGTRVRVRQLISHPELSTRLREIGINENALIRPVNRGNGSLICEVCNTRIGLTQMLARSILITMV